MKSCKINNTCCTTNWCLQVSPWPAKAIDQAFAPNWPLWEAPHFKLLATKLIFIFSKHMLESVALDWFNIVGCRSLSLSRAWVHYITYNSIHKTIFPESIEIRFCAISTVSFSFPPAPPIVSRAVFRKTPLVPHCPERLSRPALAKQKRIQACVLHCATVGPFVASRI